MSQQNQSTLQSAITTQLADNITGDISAADVRDNLINMTDSLLFNTGSAQSLTGSLTITEGITGSLQGTATTASYVETAQTAQTASYVETAQTASYVDVFNIDGTGPFAITGSNSFIGDQIITGSITVSGSNISHVFPVISSSLSFVDDAAAAAGGVPLGGLYRSGNFILIRID
jgi:hypothetical protein